MIAHLLLFACACTLGMAKDDRKQWPRYVESLDDAEVASTELWENVVSMEGNIPLLNDSRRHSAEIFHVIYYEARAQASCTHPAYAEDYQPNLNVSAPKSLKDPEAVIEEAKELIETVQERTVNISRLVRSCSGDGDCNEHVDEVVKKNPQALSEEAELLLAAGEAAREFRRREKEFDEVVRNLRANSFVIQGQDELENIVEAFAHLLRLLNPLPCK